MKKRLLSLILTICLCFGCALAPAEESPAEPAPTQAPAPDPTQAPAPDPTQAPAPDPTQAPAPDPTQAPAPDPTQAPAPETQAPTQAPEPTAAPATPEPTQRPRTAAPRNTPVAEATPFVSRDPSITEIPEPVFPDYDFSDMGYLLPVDFSSGPAPKRSGFHGDTYRDSTIEVTVSSGRYENCDYWKADIRVNDASQIRTVAADNFNSTSARDGVRLAQLMNAVVAINGDYYNSSERGGKGFVLRQGILYRNNLDLSGIVNAKMMDVLLIDEDGNFHPVYLPEKNAIGPYVDGKRILNALTFGPILVDGGRVVEDFSAASRWIDMAVLEGRQRMCICQTGRLSYMVIACAGPSHGSAGLTLSQFAQLAANCGAVVAYNLDGGDSTMLYFNGKKINSPYSTSARKLQDIIYFASAEGK